MKGYRFYLEYDTPQQKRKGEHNGNVVAIIDVMGDGFRPQNLGEGYGYECVAAVHFHPNSSVCGCSTTRDYLRVYGMRVPETRAREIHPRLFETLDSYANTREE